MENFIQALPTFGIVFAIWFVGLIILDFKSFFKQEVYIMDKSAIIIAIVCYGIMLTIIGALSFYKQ